MIHTPGIPYPSKKLDARGGFFSVDCSCGRYTTSPCSTIARARAQARAHADAMNRHLFDTENGPTR